jgi:hypothetical protein
VPKKDDSIIADTFNTYFIEKIENLKQNIDNEYKEDPFSKLEQKLKSNKSKFTLKKFLRSNWQKQSKRSRTKRVQVSMF